MIQWLRWNLGCPPPPPPPFTSRIPLFVNSEMINNIRGSVSMFGPLIKQKDSDTVYATLMACFREFVVDPFLVCRRTNLHTSE
jgi:hypothetical protein